MTSPPTMLHAADPGEHPWTLPGSDGEAILGVAHVPAGDPVGTVVLAHGFKGYMDYGMFPRLARELSGAGFVVHRFNFSHSGMTRETTIFERPDLFERDTWNRQVDDLAAIARALETGGLAGGALPRVWFGHSRGGASVLLAVGRGAVPMPAGVVVAAAPADADRMSDKQREQLLERGFLVSPSGRTGQELRVGEAWLTEQQEDPHGHSLAAMAGRIACPMLIVHGEADETVPAADAHRIAEAAGAPDEHVTVVLVPGANHVFDTPNPLPDDAPTSAALQTMLDAIGRALETWCDPR